MNRSGVIFPSQRLVSNSPVCIIRTRKPFAQIAVSRRRRERQQDRESSKVEQVSLWFFVFLVALHIIVAGVEKGRPLLVTLHGLATLGFALVYGTNPGQPLRTMQAVAYICGAEVLWRMCARSGALPWEFGKLAVIAVLLIAILRRGHVREPWLPILYFVLLLPAAFLTFARLDLNIARQALSANLSGPLTIALCIAFMSHVRLSLAQLSKALCFCIIPIAGVAFLCYSGTFGASEISFGRSSNKAASGGFGPNQVSVTLGLGVLGAMFWFATEQGRPRLKGFLLLIASWFAVQSALTFSRSGLYLTALSAAIGAMPLMRSPRLRWTMIGSSAVGVLLVHVFLLPALNAFTGGALEARFRDTDLTNRERFWTTELNLWVENPVLGVGVGVSDQLRMAEAGGAVRAHTEYTRVLAEHGMLGVLSFAMLALCLIKAAKHAHSPYSQAVCLSMATFAALFMIVSATRLALLAFALGLCSVKLLAWKSKRREHCEHSACFRADATKFATAKPLIRA